MENLAREPMHGSGISQRLAVLSRDVSFAVTSVLEGA